MQLAAGQRGLQQIARIHRAFGFACANQRMHLINEENDMAFAGLHFIKHTFEALFKLAAIFGARDQTAHVERHQRAVLERVRHVTVDDALGEAFGNRRLADAGFTDEDRVVLGATREDLDCAADFFIAANHRVQLAFPRGCRQVTRELLERIITVFGRRRVGGFALAQLVDGSVQRFGLEPCLGERLSGLGRAGEREGQQQPLYGDIAVPRLGRDLFGLIEHADQIIVEPRRLVRAGAGDGGNLGQRRIGFAHGGSGIAARGLDQPRAHAFIVFEQRFQQMLRRNPLMVHPDRDGLR